MTAGRNLIVAPNCIIHSESPKTDEFVLWIVKCGMDYITTRHAADSLNRPFGHAILELSADTAESELLLQFITMFAEFPRAENAIIGMVAPNLDIDICSFLLEKQLTTNSFSSVQFPLRVVKEITTSMIDVNSAPSISMPSRTMTRITNDTSWDARDVMIAANAITWLNVILFDEFDTRWGTGRTK